MSAEKLHNNEEQTYNAKPTGIKKILQVLQVAQTAQGNKVGSGELDFFAYKVNIIPFGGVGGNRPVALMARAPDSKSGCWGFKSLLACHLPWILKVLYT